MDKPEPLSDDEILDLLEDAGLLTTAKFKIINGLVRSRPAGVIREVVDRTQRIIAARYEARIAQPIPMVLHCPACGTQHIDAPEPGKLISSGPDAGRARAGWSNPPHRSHLCHGCGHIWRPADICTVGVAAVATKGSNDSPPPSVLHDRIAELERERDELVQKVYELERERDALRADAQDWMLIEEDAPVDVPLDTPVLLAWWSEWSAEWKIEVNFAGSERSGWRHGRATHWKPRPKPPAARAAQEKLE